MPRAVANRLGDKGSVRGNQSLWLNSYWEISIMRRWYTRLMIIDTLSRAERWYACCVGSRALQAPIDSVVIREDGPNTASEKVRRYWVGQR
jgi:hypothetical protein